MDKLTVTDLLLLLAKGLISEEELRDYLGFKKFAQPPAVETPVETPVAPV
jgi:hypothetical protein